MLHCRRISLRPDVEWLKQPLIRRETLEDCGCVDHMLEQAGAEADMLLARAQTERDELLARCEQSFWQQADETLMQWDNERQAMWDTIETHATTLVEQIMERVFNQVAATDQLRAMVDELTRVHRHAPEAEIHCHPSRIEAMQALLEDREQRHWRPVPDSGIEEDTLRLETNNGHFTIGWQSIRDMLKKGLEKASTD